jgi:hypothetical protein
MLQDKPIERGEAMPSPEQIQRAALTIAKIEAGSVGTLEPEFLPILPACKFSGIGRTELYLEIRAGRIKSISLRKPGRARGRRLVSVASLRQYLASFQEGATA